MTDLFTLILQIGIILLVARVTGRIFRAIHQPQVVGEMAAGFVLGPTGACIAAACTITSGEIAACIWEAVSA